MNPIPEDLGIHDVGQWLGGGWFLFKKDSESAPEPGKLGNIEDRYGVEGLDGTLHEYRADLTFPFWPVCGAINLSGFAIFVARRQVRQYRRTYNDQCIEVSVPRKWDVMKRHGTDMPNVCANSAEVVREVFSPVYYTYSQAMEMMESGAATSVALNPQLIVAGPLVYYNNTLVAKMDGQRLIPLGCDNARIRRLVKFFEGRVTL